MNCHRLCSVFDTSSYLTAMQQTCKCMLKTYIFFNQAQAFIHAALLHLSFYAYIQP